MNPASLWKAAPLVQRRPHRNSWSNTTCWVRSTLSVVAAGPTGASDFTRIIFPRGSKRRWNEFVPETAKIDFRPPFRPDPQRQASRICGLSFIESSFNFNSPNNPVSSGLSFPSPSFFSPPCLVDEEQTGPSAIVDPTRAF